MKNVFFALILVVMCHHTAIGDTIELGPSGACIVDRTLNYERFYYCGHQDKGCAGSTENRNDISYVHYDGDKFTTVGGWTRYCCGGTTSAMGKIQSEACDTASAPTSASASTTTTTSNDTSATLESLHIPPFVTTTTTSNDTSATPTSAGWGGAFVNLIEKIAESQESDNADVQECPPGIRFGNNPENGKCIECPIGKYFNADNPGGGYCNTATVLNKTDLMYGYGQTRNSNPKLHNQCWHIKDPDKYRRCVLSGGNTTTNPVLKVLLQHSVQQLETKPSVSEK